MNNNTYSYSDLIRDLIKYYPDTTKQLSYKFDEIQGIIQSFPEYDDSWDGTIRLIRLTILKMNDHDKRQKIHECLLNIFEAKL